MKKSLLLFSLLFCYIQAFAQSWVTEGLTIQYEAQVSASSDKTPLWLNANKYGLSSLSSSNGYARFTLTKPVKSKNKCRWDIGYGLDFASPYNYTTNVVIQQLYFEGRYRGMTLSLGSKNHPMQLKNQRLSSGSQTLGINARPIPELRFSLEEFLSVPYTRGWLAVKGHISYGIMTDGDWQRDFTQNQSKWTDKTLYHSKAGYLRIGKESSIFNAVFGLEMATIFGGNLTWYDDRQGKLVNFKGGKGLKDYWHAFLPGGEDFQEQELGYVNAEGDLLGSWNIRINYKNDKFGVSLYADRFFEDHSGLYNLGFYGYGKDGDWEKRSRKLYVYPLKDALLGLEISLFNTPYLNNIVFEFINTRYQSGPIYHDHNASITDQIGGRDNYYNHTYYPGWQYYGQVIGNPLYLSPLYNTDGNLEIKNNRFHAFHAGAEGKILPGLGYRVLYSWQKGFGTYDKPFDTKQNNMSILAEFDYNLSPKIEGLSLRLGYGHDNGELLGNNNGVQLTVTYKR